MHLSRTAQLLKPSVFSQLTPKIKELGARCIPLHIGDTYRLPPRPALDALHNLKLDSTRFFKYTHPFGRPALLEQLVEKLAQDNGITTTTDCIQVTCGATQALCATAQTFLDPGDELIVLCPHWPLIRGIVQTVGGTVVDAPYSESVLDPDTVLGPLVTPKTKGIYFANPNNPDGQLLDRQKSKALYDFAQRHDLYLWSDEAYEHIVFDDHEKLSMASLDNGAGKKRVISIFTFSKSFGMAGLRVGYVVAPAEIMNAIRSVSTHQIYDLSDVNQEAALAALQQPQEQYREYLESQRLAYQEARDLLHSAFTDCPLSPGGAYLFVPFGDRDEAWDTMLRWLDKGLSSAPGEAFGGLHSNYLRLCFTATPKEVLQRAVDIIKDAR